jgi:hypothetical protein
MLGSAVYVYGLSGPLGGQARVKLDDREVAQLNMTVRTTYPSQSNANKAERVGDE